MTDTNKVEPEDWRVALETCRDTAINSGAWESYKAVGEAFDAMEVSVASALAAEQLMVDVLRKQYQSAVFERDTLRTQLAEAQAEIEELRLKLSANTNRRDTLRWQRDFAQANAARYRNALVGLMACTLRADCPPDIYDAAEKALKGDV